MSDRVRRRSRGKITVASGLIVAGVAASCWVLTATAAPKTPAKPRKAAVPAAAAGADATPAGTNAADDGPSIRLPDDPPATRLTIKDEFEVDQPVTADMLASLAAPPAAAASGASDADKPAARGRRAAKPGMKVQAAAKPAMQPDEK